jgi:hypothetical protein
MYPFLERSASMVGGIVSDIVSPFFSAVGLCGENADGARRGNERNSQSLSCHYNTSGAFLAMIIPMVALDGHKGETNKIFYRFFVLPLSK